MQYRIESYIHQEIMPEEKLEYKLFESLFSRNI